jgi:hypothetical protein
MLTVTRFKECTQNSYGYGYGCSCGYGYGYYRKTKVKMLDSLYILNQGRKHLHSITASVFQLMSTILNKGQVLAGLNQTLWL